MVPCLLGSSPPYRGLMNKIRFSQEWLDKIANEPDLPCEVGGDEKLIDFMQSERDRIDIEKKIQSGEIGWPGT